MATGGRTECAICFLNYEPNLHVPKVLNCGHTFCVVCLDQLCRDSKITCPKCKQACDIPNNKPASLTTNFDAFDGTEELCRQCKMSLGTKPCPHCSQTICDTCFTSHNQTHVEATKSDLEEMRKALERLQIITVSKETLLDINQKIDDVKLEINSLCEGYNQATERLRKRLIDKADNIKLQNNQAYKNWMKNIVLKQGEGQTFLIGSEVDLTYTDALSISRDTLSDIQRQCDTLLEQVKATEAALPNITECRLQTTGNIVSHISKSAEISTTQPNLADTAGDHPPPDLTSLFVTQPDTAGDHPPHDLTSLSVTQPNTAGDNPPADLACLPVTPPTLRPHYSKAKLVKEVGGYGESDGEFDDPRDVACLPSERIIITDQNNDRVQFLDTDLQHIRSVGSRGQGTGQFCSPEGVAVDSQGRLFIADNGNHRVQVMDEDGRHLYMFGSEGSGPGQYQNPAGIAIDTRDRVYVCDYTNSRVEVVTTDGIYITTLTQTGAGPGQLRSGPYFISTNDQNHVTVTDWDGHVYMYDDSGNHIKTLVKGQSGRFGEATRTVSDPWGNLLVADCQTGCVWVMDREGQVSCKIGSKGTGPGQMMEPYGITLTSEGDLLVCDNSSHKVLKYEVPKSAMDI